LLHHAGAQLLNPDLPYEQKPHFNAPCSFQVPHRTKRPHEFQIALMKI
jgi:hypothetical protein